MYITDRREQGRGSRHSPTGTVLLGCLGRRLHHSERKCRAEVRLLDHLPELPHPRLLGLQCVGPEDHLCGDVMCVLLVRHSYQYERSVWSCIIYSNQVILCFKLISQKLEIQSNKNKLKNMGYNKEESAYPHSFPKPFNLKTVCHQLAISLSLHHHFTTLTLKTFWQ